MVITIKDKNWFFGKHDAFTFFPFVLIKESQKNNKALVIHEETHIKQFLRGKLFCYYLSKECKYQCEKEAYLNQLLCNYNIFKTNNPDKSQDECKSYWDLKASHYAGYIQSNYGLPSGSDEKFMKDANEYYYTKVQLN